MESVSKSCVAMVISNFHPLRLLLDQSSRRQLRHIGNIVVRKAPAHFQHRAHENEAERRAKPKSGDAPTREQAMADFKARCVAAQCPLLGVKRTSQGLVAIPLMTQSGHGLLRIYLDPSDFFSPSAQMNSYNGLVSVKLCSICQMRKYLGF